MSGDPNAAAASGAATVAPGDVVINLIPATAAHSSSAAAAAPAPAPAAAPAAAGGAMGRVDEDALPGTGPVLKPHNSVQTVDGVFVGPGGAGAATAGGVSASSSSSSLAVPRAKGGIKGYASLDSGMTSAPSQARLSAVTGLGAGVAGGPPPSSSSGSGRAGLDPLPADGAVVGAGSSAGAAGGGGGLKPPRAATAGGKSLVGHSSFTAGASVGADGKVLGLAPRGGADRGPATNKLSSLPAALEKDKHGTRKIKMLDLMAPIHAISRLRARSASGASAEHPALAEARAKAAASGTAPEPEKPIAIRLPGQKGVLRHHSSADVKLVREHVLLKADSKEHSEQPPLWLANQFHTNLETGLTEAAAAELLLKGGKNELEKDPPEPMWKLFLMQFTDLLVAMLIVAAIIAAALGEYASSVVIIIIVMANAILGLTQESRAGAALEALAALHAPKCEVIRGGKSITVESTDIVPGDLILLPLGCTIPADIRLTQCDGFAANEMPLTGESMPVRKTAATARSNAGNASGLAAVDEKGTADAAGAAGAADGGGEHKAAAHHDDNEGDDDKDENKDKAAGADGGAGGGGGGGKDDNSKEAQEKRAKEEQRKKIALTEKNCVYMGCQVVEGNGRGIVVKTGMSTKMGEIAKLMELDEDEGTPLQNKLRQLGKVLGIASIVLSLTVFIVGMSTGRGVDKSKDLAPWLQMLLITVSLVVAAVPEGLPACVTITLAMGMQKMSEKKAQIRNLRSVETLGSASVICTDKTGTLTCGKMTLVQVWTPRVAGRCKFTGVGYAPEGKLLPVGVDEKDQAAVERARADWDKAGNPHHMALLVAAMDSTAEIYKDEKGEWDCKGNMSECPIVVGLAKAGYALNDVHKKYPKVQANPFSSLRKLSSTIRDTRDGDDHFFHGVNYIASVKGAPDRLIARCNRIVADGAAPGTFAVRGMTPDDLSAIHAANQAAGEQAFRVLAVAYKPLPAELPKEKGAWCSAEVIEKDLVFLGLLFIIDPERPEVGGVIRQASFAGIRTVMITGDHVITAKAIAENVQILPRGSPLAKAADCEVLRGYGTEIIRLEKLIKDTRKSNSADKERVLKQAQDDLKRNQDKVDEITAYCDVYARAQPKDKITIVRSLQRQGHVCSMTGDGVNDAPALRRADIGVAMGKTGTEVARAAAAMVLTDDNFVSIVLAIEEGRTIYNNIQKFVFYLLSTNVSEVLLILVGVLAGYPSPLEPIQILWLNLATDGAPAIALAVELPNPGLMEEGPRNKKDPILEPLLITGIVIQNLVMTGCCVFTYILGLRWNTGSWHLEIDEYSTDENSHAVHKGRTMCIIYIVFAELLRAYSSRSLRHSIFTIGWFTNRWMQYGTVTAVLATILFALTPGLQDVFGMVNLDGREWGFVIGFSFAPFVTDEITKCFYRCTGYGVRPRAQLLGVAAREAQSKADAANHKPQQQQQPVTVVTQMPAEHKAN